jgi:hypothetical protein
MAFIKTKEVLRLVVLNNDDNIVSEVNVKFSAYDDAVSGGYVFNTDVPVNLDTDVDTSSESFVQFDNLTEDIVLGWCSDQITDLESACESLINERNNPPAPPTVEKSIPW